MKFVQEIHKRSSYYKLKLEEVGRSVSFLEMTLMIDGANNIVWEHYMKAHALKQVLSKESAHPHHVHEAWQMNYTMRAASLTRRPSDKSKVVKK
eukprot:1908880-Prorocentrum_lima.AAC.1